MAALDADESVWTWGFGASGALGNNSTANSPYAVQVVDSSGTPLAGITQIACGGSGFCLALARNGIVWGWGTNANSQLGTAAGGQSAFAKPVFPPGSPAMDIVAAGTYHGLAHARNGAVYGWGYNNKGQLGNGSTSAAQAPPVAMSLSNGPDIIDLGAGGFYSAMVDSQRRVWVTGDNQYGQLGLGNQNTQYVPVISNY
jgi:alpha-tubulin suppressor-like RCC1 family protein